MLALVLAGALTAASAQAQAQAGRDGADFIVFFDWAKPDINRDAAEILDKVAAQYAGRPGVRLVLSGHSDRSGPSSVNLRSSKRRAEAVRDYLETHGVPAPAIILEAYGEQRPIVDTEDGVREVQNRRVEIRFLPNG
jgi:outer membrane protein OmpA-like peptidoglycan-associated protein